MLRLATDPDNTWVPYAETNKQLTDRPNVFVGTTAEWNALTAYQKARYQLVNLTDDKETLGIAPVDVVEDGNMSAITSNAVADYIKVVISDDITATLPANRTINVQPTPLDGYEVINFQVYITAWSGSTEKCHQHGSFLFGITLYFESGAANSGTYKTVTTYKKILS